MQKRLSGTATMVGINGDFYAPETGRPSGVVMRGGVVDSPPLGDRSSVGFSPEGSIDVRRVEFFGTWRGLGQRRTLTDLNQAPKQNGISLFTPSYGPATPAQVGVSEVVIHPFPPATPNTDLTGPVVQFSGVGGTPIPRDGAVLVARGTAAQRLVEEAPIGSLVTLRVILRPEWSEVSSAVGGGPVIVRNGGPVFRANEAFSTYQLSPRHPRTTVGQRADGRIIMVVVDGRRPGYSVGMTNFELAQALVRLGAVTASGFDGGGSSTLAFNGALLNRPSDSGGERPASNALQLMYYGVYAPTPDAVVSPNGDGYGEQQRQLSYKVVRPSTVTVTLVAPGEVPVFTEELQPREPGTYPVAFPPAPVDPLAEPEPLAEGRWRLDVTATDDLQRDLDDEPAIHRQQHARVREALPADAGRPRARHADDPGRCHPDSAGAGDGDGRDEVGRPGGHDLDPPRARGPVPCALARHDSRRQSLVYGGMYVVRFRATNELGAVELVSTPFRVIRAAPVPVKKPKPKG